MYYRKRNRRKVRPPKTEGDRLCITGKKPREGSSPGELKETDCVLQGGKNRGMVRPLENRSRPTMYYGKGNRERIRPSKSEGDRLCITGKKQEGVAIC